MHDQVRVLRVPGYVLSHRRTNNIHLEVVLASPLERTFRQGGCKTHVAYFFRNFGMDQLQDVSAQTIFQIGDFTVPLDFYAASRYQMQR